MSRSKPSNPRPDTIGEVPFDVWKKVSKLIWSVPGLVEIAAESNPRRRLAVQRKAAVALVEAALLLLPGSRLQATLMRVRDQLANEPTVEITSPMGRPVKFYNLDPRKRDHERRKER